MNHKLIYVARQNAREIELQDATKADVRSLPHPIVIINMAKRRSVQG